MLALIFAVVSLSSIDPDPIVTPAPTIHDRITATGFAPGGSTPRSGLTSEITVAPACTFGVPQFGRSLWNDAASLARFTQPECAGIASSSPWLPSLGGGFVRLAPAPLGFAATGPTTKIYTAPLPSRFTALAPIASHGASGPVARARAGAERVFARGAAAGAPRVTERRH